MKVIISCEVEEREAPSRRYELMISDDSFDTIGYADVILNSYEKGDLVDSGKTMTIWLPDLTRALLPFMARYYENKEEMHCES